MIIRSSMIIFGMVVGMSISTNAETIKVMDIATDGSFKIAQTNGQERRDTRQNCRQAKGAVGADKRNCKQTGRQISRGTAARGVSMSSGCSALTPLPIPAQVRCGPHLHVASRKVWIRRSRPLRRIPAIVSFRNPQAGTQPCRREPLFMPPKRPFGSSGLGARSRRQTSLMPIELPMEFRRKVA